MSLAPARLATPCGKIWRLYAALPTTIRSMGLHYGAILPANFWPLRATRSDSDSSSTMTAATQVNRQWRLKSRPTGVADVLLSEGDEPSLLVQKLRDASGERELPLNQPHESSL